ncbi:MAG: response regulator transcription factor [Pseudomonadales bacterium]|jgi:DNA-binding NarL/FixJ family response regulator|nr:response regulator transcription factor [Pseudomonadales bacterium]
MQVQREKLEVLLVDDHDLFREGLKLVLGQLKSELHFHEAGTLAELGTISQDPPIDLVLLDYHLPDNRGFEGLTLVRQLFESAMIVVISGENNPRTIQQAIVHGASGFIPKASSGHVLMAALQLILAGGIYLPAERLSEYFIGVGMPMGMGMGAGMSMPMPMPMPAAAAAAGVSRKEQTNQLLSMLSGRQREVLIQALLGKTNKIIARELGISDHTVKAHLSIAFKALGVSNRCEAVYAAARFGIELPLSPHNLQPSVEPSVSSASLDEEGYGA